MKEQARKMIRQSPVLKPKVNGFLKQIQEDIFILEIKSLLFRGMSFTIIA
jgi:hypothetical protein